MKDKPLMISLLIGLIVILVIGGVSILVKMNSLSDVYKKKLAQNLSLQKKIEDFRQENESLKEKNSKLTEEVGQLNSQVSELEIENTKLEKLKEKLEESLKEELMKKEPKGR